MRKDEIKWLNNYLRNVIYINLNLRKKKVLDRHVQNFNIWYLFLIYNLIFKDRFSIFDFVNFELPITQNLTFFEIEPRTNFPPLLWLASDLLIFSIQ